MRGRCFRTRGYALLSLTHFSEGWGLWACVRDECPHLFLLSLLVHQSDRRRMALIGGVFVAFSGLMYFAFMAAWLGLFLVVGGLPWVTAAAGGVALVIGVINVKDFVAFRKGLSLSIPEAGKADIFQRARAILKADSLPAMLAATVFLGVAANFYEDRKSVV